METRSLSGITSSLPPPVTLTFASALPPEYIFTPDFVSFRKIKSENSLFPWSRALNCVQMNLVSPLASLFLTQQTLVMLGESRAAAGLLLDQLRGLQVEPAFAATVAPLGGALELRWQSVCRQTELETQRCRDRRDSMSRWESCSLAVELHTHSPARSPPVSDYAEHMWVFYYQSRKEFD